MPTTRINEFLAAMVEESDRGLVIGIISIADQSMDARLEKMFNQGNARARESVERAFGSFGGRVMRGDTHRVRRNDNHDGRW